MLADSNIYTSVEYLHKCRRYTTQRYVVTLQETLQSREPPSYTRRGQRRPDGGPQRPQHGKIILLVDADKKTAVGGRDDDDDGATTTKTTFEMAGILKLELMYSRIGISNAVAMVAARWRSSRRCRCPPPSPILPFRMTITIVF